MSSHVQKPQMFPGGVAQMMGMAQANPGLAPGPGQAGGQVSPWAQHAPMNTSQRLDQQYRNQVAGYDANAAYAPQAQQSSAQLPGAQQHAVSPWAQPAAAPQMNTQQRLDQHYGNMVAGFDANPYAGPVAQRSSAQLPGATQSAASPWAQPAQQPAQAPAAGGGGGFLSKIASLFAGLF
jgi:hypothetical protein